MKVLVPISLLTRETGPGQAAVGLIRGLSKYADVDVLTFNKKVDLNDCNIFDELGSPSVENIITNILKIRELSRDVDIIYVPVSDGLITLTYFSFSGKKIIGGPNVRFSSTTIEDIFTDHLITHSQFKKEKWIRYGIKPDKMTPIALPVETDIYRPDRIDSELMGYREEGYINILFAGVLNRRKGILNLIDAFLKMHTDNKVKLNICGKGPLKQDIEEYSNKNENIIYHGFVSDERLADLYATADLACFPSKTEPFGLVYIESMASGTATIGVNNSGPKEIITHKSDGYLIENNSVKNIQKGLEELVNDRPLREKISKNARKTAENKYSVEIVGKKLYEVLKYFLTK